MSLVAAGTFTTPRIDYGQIAPMLLVFGGAGIGVLVEAFAPPARRRMTHVVVAVTFLIGALASVIVLGTGGGFTGQLDAVGAVAIDGPTLFLQGTLIVLGIASVLLLAERRLDTGGAGHFVADAATVPGSRGEFAAAGAETSQTEVFPLAMFAFAGMLLFPASNNLLTMFVALEVLSLPLYLMCGLARRRRLLSQEAAVKYFLLGAFSSAFFLYGLALLYGYANSVDLGAIFTHSAIAHDNDLLLIMGFALIAVGLFFKIGAVPFHSWIPDVYQGAPTPVTALMASGTKVAAFGALLRVLYVAFGRIQWDWRPVMWGVAIIAIVVGAVLAVTQTDIKRMLAYSTIAHTGFILVGVLAFNTQGLSGSMFYLVAYGFSSLGAFALVTLVRDADGEATHLSQWRGLGKRSPLVAGVFALFLLAFAGIPLTSGFTSKFAVFQAGITGGAVPVVVVAAVMSTVTAFFYARVIVLMFFSEPAPDGPTVAIPSGFTTTAVALGAAVTVVLGVVPQPLLDVARNASVFVH